MSEMNRINEAALEQVIGGVTRTVQNDASEYSNIRMEPGLKGEAISRVKNGTKLVTTGNTVKKDGYVWYEVRLESGSDDAWIAGSLIGY